MRNRHSARISLSIWLGTPNGLKHSFFATHNKFTPQTLSGSIFQLFPRPEETDFSGNVTPALDFPPGWILAFRTILYTLFLIHRAVCVSSASFLAPFPKIKAAIRRSIALMVSTWGMPSQHQLPRNSSFYILLLL